MPQQLCHYVGGNYESDENGEGERIGAKKGGERKNSQTLKRERKLSIRVRSTSGGLRGRLEVQVMRSDERWWSVEDASNATLAG